MSVPFKVVIPARYASTRLPGKPLLSIAGKPMVLHVVDRAQEANAEEIVVATDDQRIFDVVTWAGVDVVMTRSDHNSGTERIAEVTQLCGWNESDIVVNLQGDEPLVPADYITGVAQALAGQEQAGISTLAAPIKDNEEIFNPNAVKVILDKNGYALYFSRAPIPWDRDHFNLAGTGFKSDKISYLRHIGIYAYKVGFIMQYIDWSISALETVESLEQLRILWNGERVLVVTVSDTPEAGVDTIEDLHRVEKAIQTK